MKTIIFGASGQLGQCLRRLCEVRGFNDIIFPDERSSNILAPEALEDLFKEHKPAYVVNCAAYTAVDKAEEDVDLCRKVNMVGPLNIARLCKQYATAMIHVSTDFVFKGDDVSLLTESDVAEPINVYGLTKLEGELAIRDVLPEHFILRTSWLYSEYANNFVKTMLRLAEGRTQLNVIADQIGTPTYAMDLADAILHIISSESQAYGLYHYSNEGVTSWYDFAVAIFQLSDTEIKVQPIPTSQYPTPARRPKFSVMDKSKFKETFGLAVPYWRESLVNCIDVLSKSEAI
jgi:dTDP-4-dehydrorhamnose reductase